jgi:hypothetical protein
MISCKKGAGAIGLSEGLQKIYPAPLPAALSGMWIDLCHQRKKNASPIL